MAGDRGETGGGKSLRLAALNGALRWLAKPRLARVRDPAEARLEFTVAARLLARPPVHALYMPVSFDGPEGPLGGLHVSVGAVDRSRIVLYLHGGAYVTGSPETHRAMLARLSALSGLPVFMPDYRLAPEHPFPAALEDADAAWQHLYRIGYEPHQIALGGDSAGGGIAFALLSRLCRAGTPPGAAFGFSPWADLTGKSASRLSNARRDPLLPAERAAEVAQMYLQGHPADDPEASPVFADFPGAPPVLLQYSETEILRDDTVQLAHRLRGFGAEVTLQRWEEAPHVWQFLDGWIPEARAALAEAARFLRDTLKTG